MSGPHLPGRLDRDAGGALDSAVLEAVAGRPDGARVAVVAGPAGHPITLLVAHAVGGGDVPVVSASDPAWRTWARLAALGPLDLLVDATGDGGEGARLSRYLRLVRAGGTYLVVDGAPDLPDLLRRLTSGDEPGLIPADRRALARAIGAVDVACGHVVVVRRGRTYANLREREVNLALDVDPSRGRVLAAVPGASFDSRCTHAVSRPQRGGRIKERYKAPAVYLREYAGAVCAPEAVAVQRGVVLPDSYRHPRQKRLSNRALTPQGPLFVRPPLDESDAVPLEGTYFFLDDEWRGGFGHALTDQLSRLWAWKRAERAHPGLGALLGVNRGRGITAWERVLYGAAGIDPERLVLVDRPVRVERLVAATPMFSMPAYVHPRLVRTWDRVGSALLGQATGGDLGERIFCSRRHHRRACTNRDEVEALFRSHGFRVVYPEDLPLPDQVAMFHRADVVAGFAGSGMFTVLFSDRPKHLLLLRSDTYRASNEYMIAALRGHRLDQVVSSADPASAAQRPRAAAHAAFTLDWAAEGAWLRTLLATL